jgi:hypothetical protein
MTQSQMRNMSELEVSATKPQLLFAVCEEKLQQTLTLHDFRPPFVGESVRYERPQAPLHSLMSLMLGSLVYPLLLILEARDQALQMIH